MEKYIENKLSIIIPTYNEAENIVKLLKEIIAVLDNKNFEIIVVDDDSEDSTASKINNYFKNEKRIKLIQRKQKRDLVQSIKLALQTITGSNFLVMDGDGQHDPKDIPSTIKLLKNNDLVVGARNLRDIKSISTFNHNYDNEVPHIFVVLLNEGINRENLIKHLKDQGI